MGWGCVQAWYPRVKACRSSGSILGKTGISQLVSRVSLTAGPVRCLASLLCYTPLLFRCTGVGWGADPRAFALAEFLPRGFVLGWHRAVLGGSQSFFFFSPQSCVNPCGCACVCMCMRGLQADIWNHPLRSLDFF